MELKSMSKGGPEKKGILPVQAYVNTSIFSILAFAGIVNYERGVDDQYLYSVSSYFCKKKENPIQ